MSRNQIIALAVVCIMSMAAMCVVVIPPWITHRDRDGLVPIPTAPPTCMEGRSNETERKPVADLAARLAAVPIDSNLKVSFEENSRLVFATLAEKEVAFLLLLAAIDIYLEKADTPARAELVQQILPELVAIAHDMWTSSHELKRAAGPKLSLEEVDLLKESPYGPPILQRLKKFKVRE